MLSSFRSRLVLSNLLIILLGLLLIVLVFTQLLVQRTVDQKKQDLRSQSRSVATQVERLYAQRGSTLELRNRIDSASFLLRERIILINPSGEIRVDSAGKTPFATGTYEINEQALRESKSASNGLKNNRFVQFQSPIRGTNGHKNGGAVILVARVADVSPGLSSLLPFLLLALGAALLVWLLIGLYFTQFVFRPLLAITQATERMAGGDYAARVNFRGRGEIPRLARSFNYMAEQIQNSTQVLKDFLANVSHDLRTPLTMITGFSQALIDGTVREDEAESSAVLIHEEALKMERLVDDLMRLTRLESGLRELERHPVQVGPFLEAVVDRVVRAHEHEPIPTLQVSAPEDLPAVEVDAEEIERALRNLLNNALQHTPASGIISVSARRESPDSLEMEVADTGSGIQPDELPRIFERFYRSDKARARDQGNAGLGLAIVKEIVEAHGGSVFAESQPGAGTSIRITLPLPRDQVAGVAKTRRRRSAQPAAPR